MDINRDEEATHLIYIMLGNRTQWLLGKEDKHEFQGYQKSTF